MENHVIREENGMAEKAGKIKARDKKRAASMPDQSWVSLFRL